MMRVARRPIVGLTLFFLAGTWTGFHADIPWHLLLGATAILIALAAALTFLAPAKPAPNEPYRVQAAALVALLAATFGVAALNARLDALPPEHPDVGDTLVQSNETPAEVVGMIDDEPLSTRTNAGAALWKFPLAVERLHVSGEPDNRAASGTVRVSVFLPNAIKPRYGDRWIFAGHLSRMSGPRQTRIVMAASSSRSRRLSAGHGNRFLAWCLDCREAARTMLTTGISDFSEQTAILNSLLLGYRSQMPFDLYRAFAATGTLHVFAISGSHVVVLAGAIIFALSAAGLSRTRWIWILGPLLVFYTIMTGLQPSAVRACLMGMVFWLAPAIGRKPDIYASLSVAALLILAVAPADIGDLGFVLSFAAVLGIVLIYPHLYKPMERLLAADPLRLQAEAWWVRAARFAGNQIASLLAVSAAACLATAPLTALYFKTVSPISLIGNLLAVPLASLVIVTGCISLVLGTIGGCLADIYNHANLVLVSVLGASIRILSRVPGGYFTIPPPPQWLAVLFYVILGLWLYVRWVSAAGARKSMGAPGARQDPASP